MAISHNGMIKDHQHGKLAKNHRSYVFDQRLTRWRWIHLRNIPWSYTFAPKPTCFRTEARLYLFAARFVKHRFIWYRKRIPRNDFAKLKSRQNAEQFGRFRWVDFWKISWFVSWTYQNSTFHLHQRFDAIVFWFVFHLNFTFMKIYTYLVNYQW